MDYFFSIVICTIGRKSLIRCLDSLEKQNYDKDKFEVIIVNQGAASGEVVEEADDLLSAKKMSVKWIRDERTGLSVARNKGIENAKGDIVIFIDDDTIADENLLSGYNKLFGQTSALCAGGKILLRFEVEKPSWLSGNLQSFLAAIDLGEERVKLSYPRSSPVGANIAFKKEVFDRYGLFDPDFGWIHGKKSIPGEETDLCYRIGFGGDSILYCPDAPVYHLVGDEKLDKGWFRRTSYRQGRGMARMELKYVPPSSVIVKKVNYFLRSLIGKKPVTKIKTTVADENLRARIFYYEIRILLILGFLFELCRGVLLGSSFSRKKSRYRMQ